MDTRTLQQPQQGAAVDELERWVVGQLAFIKVQMPLTYQAIQRKAAEHGNGVFGLVRRGIKGQPNCFWAAERSHAVGTPFTGLAEAGKLADTIRQFGCAHVCMLAEPVKAEG